LTIETAAGYIAACMSQPNRISFAFILLILVLTGWLHLGALLLSILFSYFIIAKLNFMKPRAKWLAVAIFLALLAGIAYALTYFIHATVRALPNIADRAVPAIVQWATDHQIKLPFTDLETLKEKAFEFARSQASNLGAFADVARGATTQFVYLFIGCIVAIGLYINPRLDLDQPPGTLGHNLYSLCCEEFSRRFATFYRSFAMVTNAQITISAINTILTGLLPGQAADKLEYLTKSSTPSQTMGTGGIDYVYADNDGRRIYVPRGKSRFWSLISTRSSPSAPSANSGGHGVAVDPKSHHGFSSRNPITMFDTTTLETIKTIRWKAIRTASCLNPRPNEVYVFSHRAPNVTVIDPKDGSIAGTIDLGGAPEQGGQRRPGPRVCGSGRQGQHRRGGRQHPQSDGALFAGRQGRRAGGLGLDAKNHILFAMCREPATCVILSADDGKILATLPIGSGTDGGGFNPNTMEAFSSQRDGTLTIIKENSPTSFEVEQTVQTKPAPRLARSTRKTIASF
jgi:hypothetical protein